MNHFYSNESRKERFLTVDTYVEERGMLFGERNNTIHNFGTLASRSQEHDGRVTYTK